jgi:hypothetical protein
MHSCSQPVFLQEIPSKAAISDDFFHKKWYNANECYEPLHASRVEVSIRADIIPDFVINQVLLSPGASSGLPDSGKGGWFAGQSFL